MLGISFSPQNYHHHQQFLSKLKENNENDMTFCYFSCLGRYCFRPMSMAALPAQAAADAHLTAHTTCPDRVKKTRTK